MVDPLSIDFANGRVNVRCAEVAAMSDAELSCLWTRLPELIARLEQLRRIVADEVCHRQNGFVFADYPVAEGSIN